MQVEIDLNSLESYRQFLAIKRLPVYSFQGRVASFPDEYAAAVGLGAADKRIADYEPIPGMFDYQRDIARMAIEKERYAVFADCGLGKTLIMTEFGWHAMQGSRRVLIVSPLMVIEQTIAEAEKFYGGSLSMERLPASELGAWIKGGSGIGITNYEAIREGLPGGCLDGLILDESSMLKSHYGKWGQRCIQLGKGVRWKLALTGTPAPNDRIEYANHAVFLDQFPTVNSFLAKFFVNRGQTDNRWELKPHALKPFYRTLSHWCIFLSDPSVYGWKDNTEALPNIITHLHHVDLTPEQDALVSDQTGSLFAHRIGGITSRAALGTIAKGYYKGKSVATNKTDFIRGLVDSWPDESTLIWCLYNEEQKAISAAFPSAATISGDTPHEERMILIDDFKSGRRRVLISKPKILGFGLNLQIATRQVFSGLQDSYESFYQAVKRSNRYGSTKPLNVHIPVTDAEAPMIETVLRKAKRVQQDTQEQERIFRDAQCSL